MNSNTNPEIPVDASPAERVAAAVERWGEKDVVERACALLGGYNAGEDFLLYAGGRHAQGLLNGAPPLYWPEAWGARMLNYVWDDSAQTAVIAGLGNQAWRVREMCAKVAATQALPLADTLVELLTDEVARVRAQAARTLGEVGDPAQAAAVRALLTDAELDVRKQAGAALARLTERFGAEKIAAATEEADAATAREAAAFAETAEPAETPEATE